MKTMNVAILKAKFSSVIDDLRKGEEIAIEYGKAHKKLAVIVPYSKYKPKKKKIGILEGQASYKIKGNFKITNEDLLSL